MLIITSDQAGYLRNDAGQPALSIEVSKPWLIQCKLFPLTDRFPWTAR
jgi:hypothetical protein